MPESRARVATRLETPAEALSARATVLDPAMDWEVASLRALRIASPTGATASAALARATRSARCVDRSRANSTTVTAASKAITTTTAGATHLFWSRCCALMP